MVQTIFDFPRVVDGRKGIEKVSIALGDAKFTEPPSECTPVY